MGSITVEDVPAGFDEAAPRYDLMVALNPGYHRHLRTAADALVERLPRRARVRLVDFGCGSGASTRALQRATGAAGVEADLVGVDGSVGMLDQARAKSWPPGVRFEHGLAQDLADRRGEWGLGDPVSGFFAAYLFRNVPVAERERVLADAYALLEPGGTLVVQEYSVAGRPAADLIWTLVCWLVVVPLSLVTSGRTVLYRYLWRSVRDFDSVSVFVDRLYACGFTDVEVRSATGWQRGILHTFRARRP